MKRLGLRIAALVALAALTGCAAGMEIPEVQQRPPLEIDRDSAALTFAGATSKIPIGRRVGEFVNVGKVHKFTCTRASAGGLEWERRLSSSWTSEMGEVFFDTLKSAGYNVVGDPQRIFGRGDDRDSARFAVGARLIDLRGNFCQQLMGGLSVIPTGEMQGEFYTKVEWEIYSKDQRRVVKTLVSEGYGYSETPTYDATTAVLHLAFASAAANLAADPEFAELLAPASGPKAELPQSGGGNNPPLALIGSGPWSTPLAEHLEQVRDAVVTLRGNGGHGSGFFISRDGYGLTNEHVVGEAPTMTVRLRSGVEIEAQVLRRNPVRDVALFKAPVQVARPLAIAPAGRLKPLDDVFAIGSPTQVVMESTVTKGVVSGTRLYPFRGREQRFIQADAEIAGGNSGGPLVDARGNVVGISDLGIGGTTYLNLFIPIAEALAGLDVSVDAR